MGRGRTASPSYEDCPTWRPAIFGHATTRNGHGGSWRGFHSAGTRILQVTTTKAASAERRSHDVHMNRLLTSRPGTTADAPRTTPSQSLDSNVSRSSVPRRRCTARRATTCHTSSSKPSTPNCRRPKPVRPAPLQPSHTVRVQLSAEALRRHKPGSPER